MTVDYKSYTYLLRAHPPRIIDNKLTSDGFDDVFWLARPQQA
jgi:hypothetical protein